MTRRCNIHDPRYAYLEQAKVSSKILHIKSTVTVVERMDHTEALIQYKNQRKQECPQLQGREKWMEALKELILICLTGWFSTGVTTKQSPSLTDSLSFYDNCHLLSTIFQFLIFSVFNPVPISALGLHNRVVQFRHVMEPEVLGISHSILYNINNTFNTIKYYFILCRIE